MKAFIKKFIPFLLILTLINPIYFTGCSTVTNPETGEIDEQKLEDVAQLLELQLFTTLNIIKFENEDKIEKIKKYYDIASIVVDNFVINENFNIIELQDSLTRVDIEELENPYIQAISGAIISSYKLFIDSKVKDQVAKDQVAKRLLEAVKSALDRAAE